MDTSERRRINVAERKFGLIAPTINGTYPDPSMSAYFRRIAKDPFELEEGVKVKLNPKTLASWRGRYLKYGFEGLMPKGRTDKGSSRKIDAELASAIQAMRAEFPKMSATMVRERLIKEGLIDATDLSLSTIQRFFKSNPVSTEEEIICKDRRAFEAERVNGIWQADTLYGPYVGTPPKRAYLQTVIDDKSRKVVSSRFVARDDAASFQETLKAAIASHGIPEKLFVDNGGPYKNEQLSLICGELGIVLIHAAVRDAASKGKIERFNRTCRQRLLAALPKEAKDSLEALNAHLSKWIATYNDSVHSSTHSSPNETFLAEADKLRYLEGGKDVLDEAFRNRITRKVAKDATVRVDHVLYDAPLGMVGEKVDIRWTPGRPDDVWIYMPNGCRRRIVPTDKCANAKAGRIKSAYEIDFGAMDGKD